MDLLSWVDRYFFYTFLFVSNLFFLNGGINERGVLNLLFSLDEFIEEGGIRGFLS